MSEPLEMVTVGSEEYRVIKTGRAQAEQVLGITRWISRHGTRAMAALNADKKLAGADMSGIEFFGKFIEAMDADALIDLFGALIGCPKEDSEVYFDVAILIDVALETFERQPSVRRLIDRFFSGGNSKPVTDELSTTSE